MTERRELYKIAHHVIDLLVASEPRPGRIDSIEAWTKAVTRRVKAEHWATVIEALEEDITADPQGIADSIRQALNDLAAMRQPEGGVEKQEGPNPSSALGPWPGPVVVESDGPIVPRPQARERIAAIRSTLGGQE